MWAAQGEPILLLHGYPQTHICWHMAAPLCAGHFTVIDLGLRGSAPPCGHFLPEDLPEEAPNETAAAFLEFLRQRMTVFTAFIRYS